MKKDIIFMAVALMLVVGGLAAAHFMYINPKLQQQERDAQFAETLEKQLQTLSKTFPDKNPQKLIDTWQQKETPWKEAVEERKQRLSATIQDVPTVPEDRMARYFYEEQFYKQVTELQQYVWNKGVQYMINIAHFDIPAPDQLANRQVSEKMVNKWLEQLSLGDAMVREVADATPFQIVAVVLWNPPVESGVVDKQTFGLAFTMPLGRLVDFINKLTSDPQHFNRIDALKIANRNLVAYTDPPLEVQILLTRVSYVEGRAPSSGQTASGTVGASPFASRNLLGSGGISGRTVRNRTAVKQSSSSWWEKLWPF